MQRRMLMVYALFLLVPALVLGVAAFRLLGHEQERLRLAAMAALEERARTAAENIALAVTDAEDGLMGTLAALPEAELVPALTEWRGKNPLIRDVFVWDARRGFVSPAARASVTGMVQKKVFTGGKAAAGAAAEAESAARRIGGALVGRGMPWQQKEQERATAAKIDAQVVVPQAESAPAEWAQQQKLGVANSARQELNDLVLNSVPSQVNTTNAYNAGDNIGNLRQQGYAVRKGVAPVAAAQLEAQADSQQVAQAMPQQAPVAPASGWLPLVVERQPSLLGWLQPSPEKPVRGIELAMDALLPKLAAALPADPPPGMLFALANGGTGHLLARAGTPAPGRAHRLLFRTPVGPVLPHWDVAVYAAPGAEVVSGGRAFLALSLLLTGIFLVAILAGGALLLLEAHRGQLDARRKTGFVSNVSHELKTPLTSIRMYAELLGEGRVRDEEKRRRYLDIIIAESQRLTRLINNVLDFSRIEQNRKSYNLAQVDAAEAIRDVLERLGLRLREAGITQIETVLPPEGLSVRTDRDVLEQVLINLVDNALKYAAAGGELRIEAAAGADGAASIRVLDRGPGVPHAEREKVFDKFYRMNHSLTGGKPGCGLGLTISRKMLRDLGGDLTCEPRPGGGACFTLCLGRESRSG